MDKIYKLSLIIAIIQYLVNLASASNDGLNFQLNEPGSYNPIAGESYQNEDWYFFFELGYAVNYYPPDTKKLIEDTRKISGVSSTPFSFDLAAYWEIYNNKLILGPSILFTSENFSKEKESFSFLITHITASTQYYIFSSSGNGLFARCDIGIAYASMELTYESRRYSESGKVGSATLIGLGYAFPITIGTRFTFTGNYSLCYLPGYESGYQTGGEIFEKGLYQSIGFNLGLLW